MDPKYYGLIEMGVTFLVVGGFVVHQLWTLRDTGPKDGQPAEDENGTRRTNGDDELRP